MAGCDLDPAAAVAASLTDLIPARPCSRTPRPTDGSRRRVRDAEPHATTIPVRCGSKACWHGLSKPSCGGLSSTRPLLVVAGSEPLFDGEAIKKSLSNFGQSAKQKMTSAHLLLRSKMSSGINSSRGQAGSRCARSCVGACMCVHLFTCTCMWLGMSLHVPWDSRGMCVHEFVRMRMCMHVRACTLVYVRACMRVYVPACMLACACMHLCAHACACACMHVCAHVCACACMHACACVCMCVHACVYMRVHMRVSVCVRVHVHVHVHACACVCVSLCACMCMHE